MKERTSRSSFVSYVGPSFLSEDKANEEVPIKDVKHRLYTIQLQVDVTTFFSSTQRRRGREDDDTLKVYTLFGNGKERSELVVQVCSHVSLICNMQFVLVLSALSAMSSTSTFHPQK